jgi:hypothetical protein
VVRDKDTRYEIRDTKHSDDEKGLDGHHEVMR